MERDLDVFDFGAENSMAFELGEGLGLKGQLGNANQFMFPAYNPQSGSQFSSTLPVGNEFLGAESRSFSKIHHGFSYDYINSIPNSKLNVKTVVGVSSMFPSDHSNTFSLQTENIHSTYMNNNFNSASAFPFNSATLPTTSQQKFLPASGASVSFFKNEHSDVDENKNQKGNISNISSESIQSTENNACRVLQVSRHIMVHPSMEKFDDDFKDTELSLIIRKVLSNSDVGTVGRIVLPKKEAEANLPPLTEREGIILNMDDIVLPVTWKFKYRFWPNNKSRMYIMESTGDFVKAHSLQAGDCFIIYRSLTSENYVVRGLKGVRLSPNMEALHSACTNECSINPYCANRHRESSSTEETRIHYSSPVDFLNNNTGFHQFSQQGTVSENSFGGLLP